MNIHELNCLELDRTIEPHEKPVFNVEVVGSSGVGKSTLLQTLCRNNRQIQPGIHLSRFQTLPQWIDSLMFGLTTYFNYEQSTRWFTRTELRSMVYLDAWYRTLEQPIPNQPRAIVWDQGPIYRLAMLQEFGPEMTHSSSYETWWNAQLKKWGAKLDLLVWLDAPDKILIERVYNRNQFHEIKSKSSEEGYEFLRRYRKTAGRIIEHLSNNQGLQVLRYDTSASSSTQIAERVLDRLKLNSAN
jgi:adenylate kinase family enzyme